MEDPKPHHSMASLWIAVLNYAPWIHQVVPVTFMTVPVMLASVSQGLVTPIIIMLVGQRIPIHLGGVALALSWMNLSGFTLIYGLASALDTLCSQSYGAGEKKQLGLYLQRGIAIGSVTSVMIALCWWWGADILKLCGIEPEVLESTNIFLRIAVIGLFPAMVSEKIKRYMQAQSRLAPVLWTAFGCAILTAGLGYFLIEVASFGVYGAGLCYAIIAWLQLLSLVGVIVYFKIHEETWIPWSKDALNGWSDYLALGLPGMLHVFLEWAAFEVTLILASWLGSDILAAQSVMLNVCYLSFMLPYAISTAVTVLVGNHVGAMQVDRARETFYAGCFMSTCLMGFLSFLTWAFSRAWASAFVSDEKVVELIHTAGAIFALYYLCDAGQIICTGALKGLGLQKLTAIGAGVCFWGITMPLTYYFSFFTEYYGGLRGLWAGFMYGEVPLVGTYVFLLFFFLNWESHALRSKERLESSQQRTERAERVERVERVER